MAKSGVNKSEHAIIYTGKTAPSAQPSERPKPGVAGLLKTSIRVDPDDIGEKLDPMSRIDFGRVFNIEHNVKVRSLGKVHAASKANLITQFRTIWAANIEEKGSHPQVPSNPSPKTDSTQAADRDLLADLAEAHDILKNTGWTENRIKRILRTT